MLQSMGSQGVGHDGATELNQNEFLHVASFSPHKEEIYCPPVSSEKTSSVGEVAAAAAAKSLQLCLTLCDPRDGSPSGFHIPGILQARTLEWLAISFSNA